MRKYSDNFIRDFKWLLSMRHMFSFDGNDVYINKNGDNIITYSKEGVNGMEAFFQWDSNGRIIPTRHPNIFESLMKTKGSCNLHIKMYSEDRANCNMSGLELRALCWKFKAPNWFREAVEKQKYKYI